MTPTSARILIATHPFGTTGGEPLDILRSSGNEIVMNPFRRRLKPGDVRDLLPGIDAVVAGTEPYNAETLADADRLKCINRVGIGLDSVDLEFCADRGIRVTYTPDAPSDSVAELTVANILNLARHIHESDRSVREQAWNRLMGRLLRELTVGVVGVGRIGSRVIRLLEPFGPRVLAHDTDADIVGTTLPNTQWCGLQELLTESDVITLHVPLNDTNHHMISRKQIGHMKTGAVLINTSRGRVVDEDALVDALLQKHLGGAAIDVFEKEPYTGPMCSMDNVVLTAHMGASSRHSRFLMELGAASDCLKILAGTAPANEVTGARSS